MFYLEYLSHPRICIIYFQEAFTCNWIRAIMDDIEAN